MATLAVVNSSPLMRAALSGLLGEMGFDPVEVAPDIGELIGRARAADRPNLLLISLLRGDRDVSVMIGEIRAWAPEAIVVFLVHDLDVEQMSACFAAGAGGYLLDRISRDSLVHSLRLAMTGQKVLPSELASIISSLTVGRNNPDHRNDDLRSLHLTSREIEILKGLADGRSNRDIGKTLGVSESTVSAQLKHICKKIHVSNRTQAALWSAARGLAKRFC